MFGRKSTGGKAPRKQLAPRELDIRTAKIHDHRGSEVALTWRRDEWYEEEHGPDDIPPFAWQVYVLQSAAASAEVVKGNRLPESLAEYFSISDGDCEHHWQVYTRPLPSILACVEHQRAELDYRNRNGIWPRMVPKWANSPLDGGYKSFIIIIDSLTWQQDSLILVDSDPLPASIREEDDNHATQLCAVHAMRHWEIPELAGMGLLKQKFMDAGFSWTIEDLRRRNNGGFSPALYPAIDPAAHEDADGDDEDHALAPLPPPQNAADDEIPAEANAIFDKDVLFRAADQFPDLIASSYTDLGGLPVHSIQSRRYRTDKEPFRVVLYLDQECPAFAPQALFACLNRGLIADESWTLDVVSHQTNLSTAVAHHQLESRRRSAGCSDARNTCVEMVLHAVNQDRLPLELVEHIQDLLVPPTLPDYSAQGSRLFRDFMLYLDPARLDQGPLVVYASPMTAAGPRPVMKANGRYDWKTQIGEPRENLMEVLYKSTWDWIPDELQILRSLCSPRHPDPHVPIVHLRLEPSNKLVGRRGELDSAAIPVSLRLEGDEPITIHRWPLFYPDGLREGAVELYDLTSNVKVNVHLEKHLPLGGREGCIQSWTRYRCLSKDEMLQRPGHFPGETFDTIQLEPGNWRQPPHSHLLNYGVYSKSWWAWKWDQSEPEGPPAPFLHEHRYAFRLKEGTTISRWVWGAAAEQRDPYNLPPIPVQMEGEATFTFEDEEVF